MKAADNCVQVQPELVSLIMCEKVNWRAALDRLTAATMSNHQTKPSDHGWVKTVENTTSRVEFYQREREDGQLSQHRYDATDVYIILKCLRTTKTRMNHPTQENMQMFRRDLSQE